MNLGTLMYYIKANNSGFKSAMGVNKKNIQDLDEAARRNGVNMMKWGGVITAAAVGIIKKTTGVATEFEKGMAEVHTLLGPGMEGRINELGETVKGLALETGKSLDDLSSGLYQVVSAFGDSAESAKILEINAKAAAAGMATTQDSINLTSAVTKAYGDTSAEAVEKVADLAFQAVRLGQTTFPELAGSMGGITGIASEMGVELEELFGAYATMTGVTGNTAEVTTQLSGILTALLKPTDAMKEAINDLGYETGQQMIETLGLGGTLDLLSESVGGATGEIAEMFGNVRALRGVLPVTSTLAEQFAEKTEEMANSAGAMDEAFKIQQDTLAATIDRVKQLINVIMVDVGNKFMPAIRTVLELFTKMPEPMRAVVTTLIALAAGIGIVIGPLLLLAGFITKMGGSFIALKGGILAVTKVVPGLAAIGKFLLPLLGPVGIILGVVAAFWIFRDQIGSVLVFVGEKLVAFGTGLNTAFGKAKELLGEGVNNFKDYASGAGEALANLAGNAKTRGQEIMANLSEGLEEKQVLVSEKLELLRSSITEYFEGLFATALEWGGELISSVAEGTRNKIDSILEVFSNIGRNISDYFRGLASDAFEWGKNIVRGITNGIKNMALAPVRAISNLGKSLRDGFTGVLGIRSPSKVFEEFGENIAEGLENGLENIVEVTVLLEKHLAGITKKLDPLAEKIGNFAGKEITDAKEALRDLNYYLNMTIERLGGLTEVFAISGEAAEEGFGVKVSTTLELFPEIEERIYNVIGWFNNLGAALVSTGLVINDFIDITEELIYKLQFMINEMGYIAAAAYNVGRDLILGFAEGMESEADRPVKVAERIAKAAVEALRNELQISSPSKVAEEIGANVGIGFEQGLLNKIPDIMNTGKDFAGQIIDLLEPNINIGLNSLPLPNINPGLLESITPAPQAAGPNIINLDLDYNVPDLETGKQVNDNLLEILKSRGFGGAFR